MTTRTAEKTTTKKPAKKASKKAALPQKRIARTAGVNAVGKCGHEFAARIQLWPIAGEPATAALIDERAQMMAKAVESFKESHCPDCVAGERFKEAGEEEQEILDGFGLPPLPELQGTLRQRAWARQERTSMLIGLVAEQMWHSSTPQLANAVFDHVLSSRFGGGSEEFGPEFQPVFDSMRTMINSSILPYFWSSRSPSPTDKDLITGWLLVHDGFRRFHGFDEERSRMWILRSKSRASGRTAFYRPDANLLLAVKIVVNTPGWESPQAMLSAVQQLLSWSNEADRGMVSGMADMSLPEVLEQIAVMRALSPREDDFPF